jgi:hypothetical protein
MVTEVKRDRQWFTDKLPIMDALWKRVLHYRENGGVEELLPRPKATRRRVKKAENKKCEITSVEDDDFFVDDF